MTVLQLILQILTAAAADAQILYAGRGADAEQFESAVAALARIAQVSIQAYEQLSGKPLDLSKLHPIEPV